jgi:hypothetical protein
MTWFPGSHQGSPPFQFPTAAPSERWFRASGIPPGWLHPRGSTSSTLPLLHPMTHGGGEKQRRPAGDLDPERSAG